MRTALTLSESSTRNVSLSLLALPVVIGFYFAARLCLTYFFFTADPPLGAMVSFALNVFFLLLASLYSSGSRQSTERSYPVRTCQWVLAFLAVSFCSLVWSETVSLPIALAYWAGMAADVAIIVCVLRSAATTRRSNQLLQGYVLGAVFIALTMWLSPTMQDLRPGDDDFFSPNAIGFTCAFGCFFAQYLLRTNRVWRHVAIFLAISLLRSLSKTTIAAFVLAEVFVMAKDTAISRRSKLWLLTAAVLVVAAFWNLITAYYVVYTNAGNQAETLTGRIGIWGFVLERALERPWLGHGFHSFRNVIPPFGSFEAWHAHNELVQQFYAYGAVGIILLVGLYTSFLRQVRHLEDRGYRGLLTGLILFIVIRGLGDTERFDLSFPLWAITLLSLTLPAINRKAQEI